MSDRKQEIRDYVTRRHEESWQVLQSLKPDEFDLPVYGDENEQGWTIRELVTHLAEAEGGLLTQAKRVVAGERPLPPDFDIDRWNKSAVRRRQDADWADLLASIQESHYKALEFLDELDESDLDLEGERPNEVLSVEGFLRRMVNHRAEHVSDIKVARRQG